MKYLKTIGVITVVFFVALVGLADIMDGLTHKPSEPSPAILPIVGPAAPIINDQATELDSAIRQLRVCELERDRAIDGWQKAEARYKYYENQMQSLPVAPQPPVVDSLPSRGGGVLRRRG